MTTEEFLNICGIDVEKGRPATGGCSFVYNWSIDTHSLRDELNSWLRRQTATIHGPYAHDVASFFHQKLKGIETPVCLD